MKNFDKCRIFVSNKYNLSTNIEKSRILKYRYINIDVFFEHKFFYKKEYILFYKFFKNFKNFLTFMLSL